MTKVFILAVELPAGARWLHPEYALAEALRSVALPFAIAHTDVMMPKVSVTVSAPTNEQQSGTVSAH